MRSLEEMAKLYVEVIEGPENGLGQHCHPEFGQSHHIMRNMHERFGRSETQSAILLEFATQRNKAYAQADD